MHFAVGLPWAVLELELDLDHLDTAILRQLEAAMVLCLTKE